MKKMTIDFTTPEKRKTLGDIMQEAERQRRRGEGARWVKRIAYALGDEPYYIGPCECSACGEEAITEWNETGGKYKLSKFCPNCGAKMLNPEEEEND